MAGVFGKDRVADLQSLGKGRGREMERLKKKKRVDFKDIIYLFPPNYKNSAGFYCPLCFVCSICSDYNELMNESFADNCLFPLHSNFLGV